MDDQYNFSFIGLMKYVLFSSSVVFIIYIFAKFSNKPIIVFCDVGQGDSTYIRTASGQDILVDFGPNKKILECLGKYMPFYDNEIDIALISHFDKDHYGGIASLAPKYKIKKLIYPKCDDNSCRSILTARNVKSIYQKTPYNRVGMIKSADFSIIPLTINNNSLIKGYNDDSEIFHLKTGKISILFTGDINTNIFSGLLEKSDVKTDILKVPHHGSRYNLNSTFLQLADPLVSVISVGNSNQYGHPHKEAISLLKALNKKYLRTDHDGDVSIELLQTGFVVKSQKSQKQYSCKYR